jgi:hypothetical protein
MAIAEFVSGTQAVDNVTEWSLTSDSAGPDPENDDGVYQIWIDMSDMVTGDQVVFRMYEMIDGSNQRLYYSVVLTGPQPFPIWVSPTFVLTAAWDATLLMLSATTATFDWSIRQVT